MNGGVSFHPGCVFWWGAMGKGGQVGHGEGLCEAMCRKACWVCLLLVRHCFESAVGEGLVHWRMISN